jgi:hypothetical protein
MWSASQNGVNILDLEALSVNIIWPSFGITTVLCYITLYHFTPMFLKRIHTNGKQQNLSWPRAMINSLIRHADAHLFILPAPKSQCQWNTLTLRLHLTSAQTSAQTM